MTVTEADRDHSFSRRAFILGSGMAAVGAALGGRLAWLSLWEGGEYKLLSEQNRVSLRTIPPRRGWIVDRAGKPLALNKPDYRLEMIPEQVADLDAALAAVAKVIPLTFEDELRIRADIAMAPGSRPVEIASNLDWPAFAALNLHVADLAGLQPLRAYSRVYPEADHFAHLLGYVGAPSPEQYQRTKDPLLIFPGFRVGKDGIERARDASLRGIAGANRVEITARGKVIRELGTKPDTPGETLKLTIDRDLQNYAARRLGDNSGSVIVIDCLTGDLLCMVSMPAYDPNLFSQRVPVDVWKALQEDDHHPLINKSAMGLYPPGSTFKVITSLAILEAGIAPATGCSCNGAYKLGNNIWHCHLKRGHGHVDLHSALPKSCDVYYYTFGRQVGIDAIATMARKLGLGQKYELPLAGQAAGLVPDMAWKEHRYKKPWGIGETLNTAIGQGYLITNPLQLAVLSARVASGLSVMPRLIDDGSKPAFPSLGIPDDHLAIVRQGMVDVVNSGMGTAHAARSGIPGITIAGKTGSAQVKRITMADRRAGRTSSDRLPWAQRDHALFVAFAPAEAPRYAASVIVEHGSHGGKAAAPIAKDVLNFLFEPELAMKALAPIEGAMAVKKAEQARAAAIAARKAEEARLMPDWLKTDAPAPPPIIDQAEAGAPGDKPGEE